ncbi:MAG TPA: hypothetical protein PLZ08_10630 [Bacillota bacterium]|jgi:hypothetical protein|nr:hypothetical protein [Bacillota bacterium]HOL10731.1 hypothetical protein [Bacillota bacterium]HPO98393.1 hypothetical protein [Bacillota bacterium]
METNKSNALQFYESPKKNIIIGEGVGKVTADDVRWLIEEVKRRGRSIGGKWAWIAIISRMDPIIDPECQKLFVELHQQLEAEGCVALAYVVGETVTIKVQAQRHRVQARDKFVAGYFRTKEEALEWLTGLGF